MQTETFQLLVNIPTVGDFASRFPPYGPFARGEGKFLFDLLMSPDGFVRAQVTTSDLDLPAVAGIAEVCYQAVQAQTKTQWSSYVKQFIGAVVCTLMEANGYQKTRVKKSVPHHAFSKGEFYHKR